MGEPKGIRSGGGSENQVGGTGGHRTELGRTLGPEREERGQLGQGSWDSSGDRAAAQRRKGRTQFSQMHPVSPTP